MSRASDHRARAMSSAIRLWLKRRSLSLSREMIESLYKPTVSKAVATDKELVDLLMRFGLQSAIDSASGAKIEGFDPMGPAKIARSKEFRLKIAERLDGWATSQAKHISSVTLDKIRNEVQDLIARALEEEPSPSTGEIARRISSQIHATEETATGANRVYASSPERAMLIARTELAQAENTGAYEMYRSAGVEELEWMAYSDGLSGDRHHEQLDGKVIRLGETFRTPLGNHLRYPGDPDGPIEDSANCRCSVRARISRAEGK